MRITNCTTPLVPHWLTSHFVWFRISPAALPTAWILPNPPSVDVASTRCRFSGGWSNKKLFESSNWWSGILKYIEKYHVYVSLCSLFIISYILFVFSSSWSKSSYDSPSPILWTSPFFAKNRIKLSNLQRWQNLQGRSGWFGFLQIRSHWRIIGRGQLGRCELWKCAPDPRNSRRNDVIHHPPMCSLDENVGGWAEFVSPKKCSEFPAMWCFCLVEFPNEKYYTIM